MFRGLSRVYVEIVLVIIVLTSSLFVYMVYGNMISGYFGDVNFQVTRAQIMVSSSSIQVNVVLKNVGSIGWDGAIVYGFDDGGKKFVLAVPPLNPGQVGGSILSIPAAVSNLVLDASGNNVHAIVYGSTSWQPGASGYSLRFDGSTGYAGASNVPSTFKQVPSTIMFWVKPERFKSYDRPVTFGSNPVRAWSFYFRTGETTITFEGFTSAGAVIYSVGGQFAVGAWRHVAETVADGRQELYVDGSLQYVYTRTVTSFNPTAPPYIGIGGWGDGSGDRLMGNVDEVLLYGTILSQKEISWNMRNPSMPVTRGLLAWYPMDEGTFSQYRFVQGKTYLLTAKVYTVDGKIASSSLEVVCG
ncbi:MAG: LamG domain-containing protein [Thermoproteota archaeon]